MPTAAKLEVIEGQKDLQDSVRRVRLELEEKLRGQESVIERALIAFLGGGHLLLEGPPGVGKTSLARALAEAFDGSFRRIQMTSDLLPSEIVGILRPGRVGGDFEFRQGPIFANLVLADELNRTSPKTQAALLEAMAEGTVTVDGQCYPLPDPFFVVATQNPFEYQGVYPLVESQLDRFMLQVKVGLPDAEKEMEIYEKKPAPKTTETRGIFSRAVTVQSVRAIRQEISNIHIAKPVMKFIHEIISATRVHAKVESGVSVRGGLLFVQALRASAYLRGRDYVNPEDVADLAPSSLSHRIRLEDGFNDTEAKQKILAEIMKQVRKP